MIETSKFVKCKGNEIKKNCNSVISYYISNHPIRFVFSFHSFLNIYANVIPVEDANRIGFLTEKIQTPHEICPDFLTK